MFFDRRECLSVFIFSVCLHYSLWIPSEMLCALHHWTAGKGAAPDPRMPVGHQHGVAGELKEIAFIFTFFTMLKNSWVKGYSFFPDFSLSRYFLVALLCFVWVAPGCLGCGCALVLVWGSSSAHLPHSTFSSCELGNAERCVHAEHGIGARYNLQVIFIFKYQ